MSIGWSYSYVGYFDWQCRWRLKPSTFLKEEFQKGQLGHIYQPKNILKIPIPTLGAT